MTFKNVSSGVLVSPYKIQAYYDVNPKQFEVEDQVKLRMIFLGIKPERGAEATRKLAEEIVAKLEGGAAFKDLASQYSDGSQRKEGGDWHWVQRKVLREDLAQVAFALKPGERSGIIEKPDGFYLMLVEEFQAAHIRSLPEARDEIEDTLKRKERARLREEWIKRLRTKSFLQTFPLK
jgi:parvulin-like peptidyl-prolyl isomerase